MELRYCMSFDIGGTFIKYGVVTNKGEMVKKGKFKTPGAPCKETIINSLIETIKDIKKEYKISCVGVSTAGQVDVLGRKISYAVENLPGYTGCDFNILTEEFNLPVFVDNDVNSAASGEMWVGGGRNLNNFLCMTLGTGVGGAIVIDKKVYRGDNFSAGEIGHMTLIKDGDKCNCGNKGCYERYASTRALIRMYKEELIKNNIECEEDYTGEYIVDLYYKEDPIASKVYNEFLDYVAFGLSSLVHILDPGTVLIGGGISAQGDPFFNEIRERFKKYAIKSYHNTVIKKAELLNDAGILGASYNAFSEFNMF